jgi:hypothetical protein
MTDSKAPHLWEMDHPYYCSEGNYFNNECHAEFATWSDFLKVFEFLCELCASSRIGSAHSYPSQYSNADLAQSIGYATNEILKAIRAEK